MKQKKNIQCILCPYKYDGNCLEDYKICYSLSNLYYGKIVNLFPFN
jgi:hypothetical protein